MFGKNVYEKRILAVISILIFVLGGATVAFGVEALGTSHSGGLVASAGIGSDIGEVWGINATSHNATYEVATLTHTAGTVTATFSPGFNVSHVIVMEKNKLYDVQGILNKSLYYSTLNVKLAMINNKTTSVTSTTNVTYVAEAFGTQTNDTSMKNINDKAISPSNMYSAITVYSSTVNNLNKTLPFNLFGLGASNFANMYGIVIDLNGTVAKGNQVELQISQSFGAPFNINLIEVFADVLVIEAVISVGLISLGMPKIGGRR